MIKFYRCKTENDLKQFATMDIETMQLNKLGDQTPVAISFVSNSVKELILIDYTKLVYLHNGELDVNSVNKLVLEMFSKFLDLIQKKYCKNSLYFPNLFSNLINYYNKIIMFRIKYLNKLKM